MSWSEIAAKLNRRDDLCRRHLLGCAPKELLVRIKTLRVKHDKASKRKYVRKESDKPCLTPEVSIVSV